MEWPDLELLFLLLLPSQEYLTENNIITKKNLKAQFVIFVKSKIEKKIK